MDASALRAGFFTNATNLLGTEVVDYMSPQGSFLARKAASRRRVLLRRMTDDERKAYAEIVMNAISGVYHFEMGNTPKKGRPASD